MKFPHIKLSEQTQMTIAALTAILMLVYLVLQVVSAFINLRQFFFGGTAMMLMSGEESLFSGRVFGLLWIPCSNLLLFLFIFALIFSPRLRNDIANFFKWFTTPGAPAAAANAIAVAEMTAAEVDQLNKLLAKQKAAAAPKPATAAVVTPAATPAPGTK